MLLLLLLSVAAVVVAACLCSRFSAIPILRSGRFSGRSAPSSAMHNIIGQFDIILSEFVKTILENYKYIKYFNLHL